MNLKYSFKKKLVTEDQKYNALKDLNKKFKLDFSEIDTDDLIDFIDNNSDDFDIVDVENIIIYYQNELSDFSRYDEKFDDKYIEEIDYLLTSLSIDKLVKRYYKISNDSLKLFLDFCNNFIFVEKLDKVLDLSKYSITKEFIKFFNDFSYKIFNNDSDDFNINEFFIENFIKDMFYDFYPKAYYNALLDFYEHDSTKVKKQLKFFNNKYIDNHNQYKLDKDIYFQVECDFYDMSEKEENKF